MIAIFTAHIKEGYCFYTSVPQPIMMGSPVNHFIILPSNDFVFELRALAHLEASGIAVLLSSSF